MKIKDLHNAVEYAEEMTLDKVAMSDSWRVKIVAAGNPDDWETKRMRQLLDRMDRQFGDHIYCY